MARPVKSGLDYFPMDIDFFSDEKIRHISAKFGTRGVVTILQIYCRIYRSGYFIEWNQDEARIFAKYESGGIPLKLLNDIISESLKRKIFDENLFTSFGILSSIGIQKRYYKATTKGSLANHSNQYLLININKDGQFSAVNSELTAINSKLSTQTKEKEIKENKSFNNEKIDFDYSELIIPEELKNHARYSEFLDTWNNLLQLPKWKNKEAIQIQETLNSFKGYNPMYLKEKISDVVKADWPMIKISKEDYECWADRNNISLRSFGPLIPNIDIEGKRKPR